MATYLVTGGAGFIGSNLVAGFTEGGHRVVVSDWMRSDERWRNLAKHPLEDIVRPEALADWLEKSGHRIDAVVHMGANSATTETDVDNILENNIRLSIDLWNWCVRAHIPFIFASSAATYGDGKGGFDDAADSASLAKILPLNAYGWSKHMVDRRIAAIVEAGEPTPPQWVGLKFFNVYGPNEYHKGTMKSVIAQNAVAVAAGDSIRLFKSYRPEYVDGGQLRDFVYVRDCVDIISWFLTHPDHSGLFNLGTGQARSWLDLAKAMFVAAGKPFNVEFTDMPETLRPKYQYFTQAKMDKLRAAGYMAPMTSLEDGVKDYMQNYLLAGDPYR